MKSSHTPTPKCKGYFNIWARKGCSLSIARFVVGA